jgi:hypothetical protein
LNAYHRAAGFFQGDEAMGKGFLSKIGFRRAGQEMTLSVGAFVKRAFLEASVPEKGAYSLGHQHANGMYELHLFQDGAVTMTQVIGSPYLKKIVIPVADEPVQRFVQASLGDERDVEVLFAPSGIAQCRTTFAFDDPLALIEEVEALVTKAQTCPGVLTRDLSLFERLRHPGCMRILRYNAPV